MKDTKSGCNIFENTLLRGLVSIVIRLRAGRPRFVLLYRLWGPHSSICNGHRVQSGRDVKLTAHINPTPPYVIHSVELC
jgi:hypothetical protein